MVQKGLATYFIYALADSQTDEIACDILANSELLSLFCTKEYSVMAVSHVSEDEKALIEAIREIA